MKKDPTRYDFKFLDEEIQAWTNPISEILRKRFLNNYKVSTLKREIEKAYEWDHGSRKKVKRVGAFLANWLSKTPPDKRPRDPLVDFFEREGCTGV